MHRIYLTICVLAVISVASCRAPNTPSPATSPLSPLPTPTARSSSVNNAPSATSGVHLTAVLGPSCPGPQRPGQVCTQPYQGIFVVTDNTGAEVSRVSTDQNGQATVDLLPGTYTIAAKIAGRLPSSVPATVTVPASQYVEVNIELDSGIR